MKKSFKNSIMGLVVAWVVALTAPMTVQAATGGLRIVAQEADSNDTGLSGLYLEVGGEQDLKFLGAPSGWRKMQRAWTSSNTEVAVVDDNGVVKGIAAGTAKITFSLGNDSFESIFVTVGESITLGTAKQKAIEQKELTVGETFDLNFYGMQDWNRKVCQCIWSASSDAVTIDDMGVVTAVKEGTAEITLAIRNRETNVLYHTVSSTIVVLNNEENAETARKETEDSKEDSTESEKAEETFESSLSAEQVYAAMISLKEAYPEGMRWTNDNYYGWNGGIYSGGYSCVGFAFMLSDAAFGNLPARLIRYESEYGAELEEEPPELELSVIRVGDILRVNGDSHSVIVLEIVEDGVIVAEGNYNSSIHWGRKISWKNLENSITYIMTRYPQE